MRDVQVLVTGATGFVAGHIIKELLTHGYSVRGTVRDLDDVGSRQHLLAIADELDAELEFVQADLCSDLGWREAVHGCDVVIHAASPMPLSAVPGQMLGPAVDGVLRIMRAAAESPHTRRMVLTSSSTAVTDGHQDIAIRDEQHWSVVEHCDPYPVSKIRAEQAAWAFVDNNPGRLELVTVLPGMVLGQLLRDQICTSLLPVQRLLAGTVPGIINVGWPAVDVRDLAIAHRLAFETPTAAGNRYLCAGDQVWMAEIAQILAQTFDPQGFRIPTRHLPDWAVRLFAVLDRETRLTVPALGQPVLLRTNKIRDELGLVLRPIENTIIDTATGLIDHGMVSGTRRRTPSRPAVAMFAGMRP